PFLVNLEGSDSYPLILNLLNLKESIIIPIGTIFLIIGLMQSLNLWEKPLSERTKYLIYGTLLAFVIILSQVIIFIFG
ncbi:MAG: hypothetical protein ACXAD7_27680, partial [Candidatus Kariarchaeaceae archaeon]